MRGGGGHTHTYAFMHTHTKEKKNHLKDCFTEIIILNCKGGINLD